MSDAPAMRAATTRPAAGRAATTERAGWVTFAAILLAIIGVLNIIYGIAALGDSSFFVDDQRYILSNLHTWGWVTLILGVIQITAAFSLFAGGLYGRIVAIGAAGLSAIAALLAIPAYPFWSLAIFAVDIVIIHQVATRGSEGRSYEWDE